MGKNGYVILRMTLLSKLGKLFVAKVNNMKNKDDSGFMFCVNVFATILTLLFSPSLHSMDWIEEKLFGSVAGKNE
jgi:hypothetical protein